MDKKSKWYSRGRLKTAVVIVVCLAAIVALPAFASAAPSVSTKFPANGQVVLASPPLVGVQVVSTGVALQSATLSISGGTLSGPTNLRTSIQQAGGTTGTWAASEVTNPKGLVVIKWTWTSSGTTTNCIVSATPPTLGSSATSYTVTGVITDSAGATVSVGAWAFKVGVAGTALPTFGARTPAAFSTTGSVSPTLTVAFTGAPLSAVVVKVDGATVSSGQNGLVITGNPVNLTPGSHQVIVTATNAGGSASTAWSFTVDTAAAGSAGCVTCHTMAASEFAIDQASRHNVDVGTGTQTAKSRFDGSQGVTLDFESEITTGYYNPSTILAANNSLLGSSLTAGQVGSLVSTWTPPTQSVFWSSTSTEAPSTAIKGLNWSSVVLCTDCHSQITAAGPHGGSATWYLDSNYPGDYEYAQLTKYVVTNNAYGSATATGGVLILDAVRYNTPLSVSGISMFPGAATHSNVTSTSIASTATVPGWVPGVNALGNRTDGTTGSTAVICAKCHKLETFISQANGGVVGGGVEGSNIAHDSHHQDQLDGSAQCVNCHIGIPHGWKRPRLLVNTDVDSAPYFDPKALGTTRAVSTGKQTGDTRKLTPGWGQGLNRQGMQSLSGADNHLLQTTTLGHQGLAFWTEASCQACGDHPGEDGVRMLEE